MRERLPAGFGLAFFFLAAGAPCFCSHAQAAPEEFVIDSGHAFPTFEVRHLGIATQRGRFNKTTGSVVLDREAGTAAVEIVIDASSIDTGNDGLDRLLRGSTFFDVAAYPQIHYRAAQAHLVAGGSSVVDGELTLLGVTKPVQLKVASFDCTRKPFLVIVRCGVDMSATFRRSEFGMTAMLGFVADDVTILIQAEAVQKTREQPSGEGGTSLPQQAAWVRPISQLPRATDL
jgi:polyisoprenoid-binding protein YceI